MYKVVDKNNETIVDKARTLQEVREKLETYFWYDCQDGEEIEELRELTMKEICRNAKLKIIKL